MNEDKAARYHRLQRRVSVASVMWSIVLLFLLLWSGASGWLRDVSQGAASAVVGSERMPGPAILIYVLALTMLHAIGDLTLGYYGGYLLERRYGLSQQLPGAWLTDQAKALVLTVVLGGTASSLVYYTMRVAPGLWWLVSGLLFALLLAGLANLAPVLLLPLFYSVKPLARESLRIRLLTLAERADARVLGAYEWGLGEKSRKANAALAGLGSTRRILVSDTMLADYSDEEIEVVLAHEIAHHVHGDIWKGLVFESVLVLVGFYAASVVLARFASQFALRDSADVAGLPLLLLTAGAVSLLTSPVAHAMSRAHERSADRFALELTRNPSAFVSAMRRLGAQNLAEEHPSKIVQWLFHSHPPIFERITAAQTFRT
jgi:STE24 endopeptidase